VSAIIEKHLAQDPVMARLMTQVGPIELEARRVPVFQSLVQAIIYQQLSGKAADTILGRFVALFGEAPFPTPAQVNEIPPEQLRAAGLSRPKIKYVQGIAAQAVAGRLPSLAQCDGLPDVEILARLTELKGVGRWTAEMFLIFNLARPDVLPVHDLGVRRGYQIAYGKRKMPEPEALDKYGLRWQPYRTFAALYLWRAVDGE
jgi:3-methyladenine DNA glycosylase/8-oxoguanine DNA glycosylase